MNWSVWRVVCFVVIFLSVLASPSLGLAKPRKASLEVLRTTGSEGCPGADDVFQAIARLFPERDVVRANGLGDDVALRAKVTVRPTSLGHEAIIRVTLPRDGERIIQDEDSRCGGLADALAVALIMQLEATAERKQSQSPSPESDVPQNGSVREGAAEIIVPPTVNQSPATASATSQREHDVTATNQREHDVTATNQREHDVTATNQPKKEPRGLPEATAGTSTPPRASRSRYAAAAHGTAALGVRAVGNLAAGGTIGASLFHDSGPGLFIQGLGLWSTAISAADGTVRSRLLAGMAGPCQRLRTSRATYWDSCLGVGWGRERISPRGYEMNFPASRAWLVAGSSAAFGAQINQEFRGFVRLSLLVHILRGSLSVQGSSGATRIVEPLVAGLMAEVGVAYGGRVF